VIASLTGWGERLRFVPSRLLVVDDGERIQRVGKAAILRFERALGFG
jgi:hypothetical protein